MPRKAIDSRIPALIRNGVQEKKRSFFVVVGDRAKDVIVHLHYIMSSVNLKQNRSVLWAYKKDLIGFTSHRKKREAKIRKEVKRGVREANTEDPFETFVTMQNIRYVYYKETEKILGNTYGMCILQDFEALTPNLLARTIETVEGGGLVILLLKGMNSLKQLYTMSMDIHSRYRTEAHDDVVARFNERFILSLGSCDSCLVVDDELNVLPISGGKNVQALPPAVTGSEEEQPRRKELKDIKDSLADSKPVGPLLSLARTVDQAKALLTFVDAISEKTLRSTVTLTAARGRGKSAAMGVAVAAAVAHGYSNIFITSPSPENLKTLFEFVIKGFDALEYMDHIDYTILQSTNPDYNKAIVRINIHRLHRQTIQYIQPQDAHVLGQAELVVIDEAAAIPLPMVRKLMGPYLVFMASTINGYEGTGRSLSLKLVQQLREQSRGGTSANGNDHEVSIRSDKTGEEKGKTFGSGRSLREITLSEPIRYAPGDSTEKWLNKVLCLDATLPKSKMNTQGCPHPSTCELVQVNRDTLFSFHPVSEKFLQQMMALYVASHYKNSPNDLQLMSDAPAHQLFVLIPPIKEDASTLPEPLCVIQVALEGRISRQSVMNSLSRGQRAGGDLIPWLVSQQFQDSEFAGLSGSRVVRIATNPDYISMGYGSRALELLVDFYEGKFASLSETNDSTIEEMEHMPRVTDAELENANLLEDNVQVRNIHSMPPLFSKLSERRPDLLDYIGVSYGLTQPLHKFWKRAHFTPVYLRQTPNDLTGEHSCVMLRPLSTGSTNTDGSWLSAYARDFHRRFLSLLSYQFRTFASVQALSISESATKTTKSIPVSSPETNLARPISKAQLDTLLSPFDLARLDSYADNMLDYHVIIDLLPQIAMLYFTGRLKSASSSVSSIDDKSTTTSNNGVTLSGVQQSILLAIGLQRKDLSVLEKELGISNQQLLAMFIKIIRKISVFFRGVISGAIDADLVPKKAAGVNGGANSGESMDIKNLQRVNVSKAGVRNDNGTDVDMLDESEVEDDDNDEGSKALKEKQRALINALPLEKYEVSHPTNNTSSNDNTAEEDAAWAEAERQIREGGGRSTVVSVKTLKPEKKKRKVDDENSDGEEDNDDENTGAGGDETKKLKKKQKQNLKGRDDRRQAKTKDKHQDRSSDGNSQEKEKKKAKKVKKSKE